MQLNSETVKFLDNSEILVTEADFPVSIKLQQMQEDAEKKPIEDAFQQEFNKLYPTLAACSSGDVPSFEKMFEMLGTSPDDVDNWYRAVRRLNPDWFNFDVLDEKIEKVKFRDGLALTVKDVRLPSVWYRLRKIETEEGKSVSEDPREQAFVWAIYPKLAGCSFGDVPTREEAYHFPGTELNKWYEVVKKLNPQLFKPIEDAIADAKPTKKKETKPPKS